jgi:hypothetical protein
MPSPFPGMDPYLEHHRWFRGLRNGLVTIIQEALQPLLPQPYFALIEELTWMEGSERYIEPEVDVLRPISARRHREMAAEEEGGVATLVEEGVEEPVVVTAASPPGEERTEPYLETYARREGQDRLVTAIEILSPSTKALGSEGRQKYLEKQQEILSEQVHLVEIDLLRDGAHTTAVPHWPAREKTGPYDYHVSIHRFDRPQEYLVYPIPLERRLPVIRIPLLPGDPSIPIDLQAVFQRVYDAGPYRRVVRYGEDAIDPPLPSTKAAWTARLVAPTEAPK